MKTQTEHDILLSIQTSLEKAKNKKAIDELVNMMYKLEVDPVKSELTEIQCKVDKMIKHINALQLRLNILENQEKPQPTKVEKIKIWIKKKIFRQNQYTTPSAEDIEIFNIQSNLTKLRLEYEVFLQEKNNARKKKEIIDRAYTWLLMNDSSSLKDDAIERIKSRLNDYDVQQGLNHSFTTYTTDMQLERQSWRG